MNDRITAGGMVITEVLAVGFAALRWAVTPAPVRGRHRAPRTVTVPLDDLLGPPTPYTTDIEHAPGVIRQGFDYCTPCARTTAGVLTRDGWTCGECLTPSGGAA